MPLRRPAIFLDFTLFMPSPLAWRGSPGADQSDRVSAFGEHYHEEPATIRAPKEDSALFARRMIGVVDGLRKWIAECSERFVERDGVLHDIERTVVEHDISVFLRHQLGIIREK